MFDLKIVQSDPDFVRQALARRNSPIDVDEFLRLDGKRRELLLEVETLKSERNKASGQVAAIKRQGGDASELIGSLSGLSERIKELDAEAGAVAAKVDEWLMAVPNAPDASVPYGKGEEDNPELHRRGEPRVFDFPVKDHVDLGAGLAGLDFERAARLTGARFVVEFGAVARLERALAQFMLDVQTREHGYTEVSPPVLVNTATMTGTGQLPKFAEDSFKLENSDYWLIPTAEVPLTNMHAGEVLEESALPFGYCAHTPCFRSEAGSYGKDTRGIIRQHQFYKVELVRFAHPDSSFDDLELLRGHAEAILQKLELPYRVITLCTGDMGFSSAKTYDLEVWLPAQDTYREISSCSNCTDFQARRANIRFKPAQGKKTRFVHTLNGSGLAVGRTLVAVLENYQQKDGSVVVPAALQPYMGGLEVIEPR
ncbi:MAG: serine--tRNA ligase [Desulfovibrionaceae bacterium]|jgi:seryl-tRNA synthetase|nr:serine--tRNA ligase [Desulfovibrionaceae bacterium]